MPYVVPNISFECHKTHFLYTCSVNLGAVFNLRNKVKTQAHEPSAGTSWVCFSWCICDGHGLGRAGRQLGALFCYKCV